MDRYFIRIIPGQEGCTLQVTKRSTVIQEPIEAAHANDTAALRKAKADIAKRLGVPEDSISY